MSLVDFSNEIGISKNYFYQIKRQSPNKYQYIFSLDSDKIKSIKKYVKYVEAILQQMEKILIDENFIGIKYGNIIKKISNTSKKAYHNYYTDCKIVFQSRFKDKDFLTLKYDTLLRFEKIIKVYNKEG